MSYTADTIARFAISQCAASGNPISNLKLQKILYFAWIDYFKKTNRALFRDDFFAWQLGPVVPSVYSAFCTFGGKPIVRTYMSSMSSVDDDDRDILSVTINRYARMSASRLVDSSHRPGGAWDAVYKNGKGNRNLIPFSLIKSKECG